MDTVLVVLDGIHNAWELGWHVALSLLGDLFRLRQHLRVDDWVDWLTERDLEVNVTVSLLKLLGFLDWSSGRVLTGTICRLFRWLRLVITWLLVDGVVSCLDEDSLSALSAASVFKRNQIKPSFT